MIQHRRRTEITAFAETSRSFVCNCLTKTSRSGDERKRGTVFEKREIAARQNSKNCLSVNKENVAIRTVSFVLQFQSSCWRTVACSRTESRIRREILSTYASNERRDLIGFNRRLHGQPDGVRAPTFFKRKKGKKTDGTWAVHLFALAARYIGLFLLSSFLDLRTHGLTRAWKDIGTDRTDPAWSTIFLPYAFLGIRTKTNSRHTENRLPSKNADSTPKR